MVISGILNVDKPLGVTSAWALTDIKWMLPRRVKAGHAGTLDPFATGVLLVMVGKATKLSEAMMSTPKQYEATIKLGFVSETDDTESPEQPFAPDILPITRTDIEQLLPKFIGKISQKPPLYSALKVGGKRACDRVREGEAIEISQRSVMVYGIEILDFTWPLLKLRIDCGRGTYIRSIARDLGLALNVGGYLTALRRTKVGEFDVASACTMEMLKANGVEAYLKPVIIP